MESASTTVPKYSKSFDCASTQITTVTVCIQAGDDDGCGFGNLQCLSEGGCDNLGCRVAPPCQTTTVGFCGDGSCDFTQTRTITASGGSGVNANMQYRVDRSGFCPTSSPTREPTTKSPTFQPTKQPTALPTDFPTNLPTTAPVPTPDPTGSPSGSPTFYPTEFPTALPTSSPSPMPTRAPIVPVPTPEPSTLEPTPLPTTLSPTTPVSEEEIGVAALIGIGVAGFVGLSGAFFFVYRKRYHGEASAGKELVEHKLREEKEAMYSPQPPGQAKVLGLGPPGTLSSRTSSSEGGDQFVLMRVKHDFEPQNADELGAKKGTMVQVTEMVDNEWAYAFDPDTGKGGIIPKQYLEDPEENVEALL